MQTKAALMVLVLLSGTIAGCTSDPDGGGNDGIDSDALDDLFDEYFQDFVNNTSITVNNHYYNNTTYVVDDGDYSTTVVNEYNNTTTVEGGEVNNYFEEYDYSQDNYSIGGNGVNGSGGALYLLDIQFNLEDLMPEWAATDFRNNSISILYTYYDYPTNTERTDQFSINCIDYYRQWQGYWVYDVPSFWANPDGYWDGWTNWYNQTIANMLSDAAYANYNSSFTGFTDYHVRIACDENFGVDDGVDNLLLFEIPIPEGISIRGFYDSNGYSMQEYVWGYQGYNGLYDSGVTNWYPTTTEMGWVTDYPPNNITEDSGFWGGLEEAFDVDFEFETITWNYGETWVGGDEDSVLTVNVNNIYPGYEYRLVVYFTMASVVPLE